MKPIIRLSMSITLLMSACSAAFAQPQDKNSAPAKTTLRVGTYDSRAVAYAYWQANMEQLRRWTKQLKEEHEKAEAAGDEKRAAAIETRAKAHQEKMHKQVFGSAPIDEILKEINDKLPEVAEKAGVDIIVRVYGIAYKNTSATFVDVTDQMVALFNPTKKTLKDIKDICSQPPLSNKEVEELDVIEKHHEH